MPYRYLEGLTMADIAFEATGRTLEELFASAADAMTNTQIQDLGMIKPETEKKFDLKAANIEQLLHDFLQELIFFKDAELLLFREYKVRISEAQGGYLLEANLKGEAIDMKRHIMLVDVKAVSWHKFKVEKTKEAWRAVVIIDV
jgi:SHS2 domain-containing protein